MSTKMSTPGKFALVIFLTIVFSTQAAFAQIQPVTLSASLKAPFPIFLYDYTTLGTRAFSVVSVFNDLNEPGWDVYFKISIESDAIKIQTNPDFIPAGPVHLLPGIATTLSGDDLSPFLDYNNLVYQGINKSEFIQTGGRLPTGFYTFCVEAYDYVTKKKISNTSCATAYIQLNSAPVITLPQKGSVIPIYENQNITFQWQASTIFSSGSILETEYSISVYEIFKECKDPENAIKNKQVTQIFESDYSPKTNLNYNLDYPSLETGKRYAIQVHAQDVQGRNSFENSGFSESSWFYYGYPEGGKIPLTYPENKKAFAINDSRIFIWQEPDNLVTNQPLVYKIKIVKTDGLPTEQAIVEMPAWFEKTTKETKIASQWSETVPSIDPIDEYAWQVTAHSGEQKIATSEVNTFNGPPLLDYFWIGNHKVYVTKTNNRDLTNLSGAGKVKISSGGDMLEVTFENISLYNKFSEWYLSSGEIKSEFGKGQPLELKPDYTPNDKALFYTDSLKISWSKENSRYVMSVKGHFEWDLPLAVDSIAKGIVKSVDKWIYYDTYKLIGSLNLAKGNNFKLLDPLNHMLVLSEESLVFIGSNNTYRLQFNGVVYLPPSIKDTKRLRMKVPFYKAADLFYIKTTGVTLDQNILLVENSSISMCPVSYFIDFSDEYSPPKFSSNSEWKGVYFENYNLILEQYVDKSYQLKLENKIIHNVNLSSNTKYIAWTDASGLDLYYNNSFNKNPAFFNTFPSELSSVLLKIDDNYVSDSYFKGTVKIPVISQTGNFSYTIPVGDDGFLTGFLDKDLTNTVFSFNPDGGQQKINLTIRKAVFLLNEKLQMTVDVDWPELTVKIPAVAGFTIWGNYAIGFYQPNSSVNLTNQVTGKLNDFDITLETLGCGSSEKAYGIGTNAIVIMAENVSGPDGPPNMNIYSVCSNPYAPQFAEGSFNILDETDVQQAVDSLNNLIADLENINSKMDKLSGSGSEINSLIESALANSAANYSGTPLNVDSLHVEAESFWAEGIDEEFSLEALVKVLEAIKSFCSVEQSKKIDNILKYIEVLQRKEVQQLYEAITDLKGFARKMLKQELDKILNKVTKLISDKTAKINKIYTDKIDSLLSKSENFVNKVIDSTMNLVSTTVIGWTKNDKFDVEPIVKFSIEVTSAALKNEINESVRNSVYKNLADPVTTFITERIANSINNFIKNEIGGLGYEIIDKGTDADLNIDFEKAFNDIADSIKSDIKDVDLQATVFNLVNDALKGITIDGLVDKILEEVIKKLTDPVNALGVLAQNQLNNLIAGSGDLASSLLSNIEMDFSNIGEKIRNGEWDKIFKFDHSHIHVKTKSVEFDAYVNMLKDDPVWGDCFRADVLAQVTMEFEFKAHATFINGKVNDFNYWFVELGAHELNVPMSPTPFTLEGADGRIFHHMNYNGTAYLPDEATKLGLAMQLYMFDTGMSGKLIKFDVTAEALFRDNGFILEMRGKADIGNTKALTLANAEGFIRLNSIEKQLVGIMNFKTNTAPLFCAGGEMGLDIKSLNDWNIYVGKRATPIYIKLFCSGNFSIQSWVDIYNSHIDLGLKIRQVIDGETPWILGKVRFYANIGFDFETSALIRWQPKFSIDEALISLSMWADIGADWKNLLGKVKRFSLVDIQLHGLLAFKSVPETNIKGELGGHARVCGIGVGFDLEIDRTF